MPHIHMHKRHIRKALILVLILACVSGVLFAVQIWESHQRQQAMLRQEEIDEPARRRREGWIEKDGQWYAPKSGLETMLVIGVGCTGGQHRSVAITRALADFIRRKGYQATDNHRDMTRA